MRRGGLEVEGGDDFEERGRFSSIPGVDSVLDSFCSPADVRAPARLLRVKEAPFRLVKPRKRLLSPY